MRKDHLLGNLGWPFSLLEDEGCLTWAGAMPQDRYLSAICTHEGTGGNASVHAEAIVRGLDGKIIDQAELTWKKNGAETSFTVNGQVTDEATALDAFQKAIAEYPREPLFRSAETHLVSNGRSFATP